MYSRIVNCTIDPAKVGEFKAALNNEFLPRIQSNLDLSITSSRWTRRRASFPA
jgi:hypothetical protein